MNNMNEEQDLKEDLSIPPGLGELGSNKDKTNLLVRIGLILLALVLGAGLGSLLARSGQEHRIQELARENSFLKAKLEIYAATVDSIYSMLDSLQIKADQTQDYPYAGGGASAHAGIKLDSSLKDMLHRTDEHIVNLLRFLSSQIDNDGYQSFIQPMDMTSVPGIYPSFGRISDAYGTRIHPITGHLEFHYGIDIANQAGTPIYATAAGKVIRADYDSGYGKRIVIDHGNGYRSLYAHLYNHQVYEGDVVEKGQIIALMGNTGLSTGPHLHYEVQYKEGKVNPANYLNRIEAYASR